MKLNATLFLPWINPVEILEKYKRGEYAHITGPNVTTKIQAKLTDLSAEKYGNDMREDRFQIKINNGGEIVIISNRVNNRNPNIPLKCRRCNTVLDTSDPNIIHEAVVIRREKHQEMREYNGQTYLAVYTEFYTTEPCCNLNCALGCIRANRNKYPPNAESDTRYLHKCLYPNSGILMESPDPEYLDINGGTYTSAEYKKDRNERHIQLGGVVITPLRTYTARI